MKPSFHDTETDKCKICINISIQNNTRNCFTYYHVTQYTPDIVCQVFKCNVRAPHSLLCHQVVLRLFFIRGGLVFGISNEKSSVFLYISVSFALLPLLTLNYNDIAMVIIIELNHIA